MLMKTIPTMPVISNKIVGVSLATKKKSVDKTEVIIPTDVKLPSNAPARLKTLRAEGKKWYLTIVYHEESERPFALFCKTNNREASSHTSDAVDRLTSLAREKGIAEEHVLKLIEKTHYSTNIEKLTRSISLLLRHGVLIKNIVYTLDQMQDVYVGTFLFQIKKALSQYIEDGETVEGAKCTECGSHNLVYSEGCMVCRDCGHSKCG